jgi:ribosome biogenesis GTPase A
MTTFLNFNAFATARGEGLHPKLRSVFERAATSPVSDIVIRHDGFLQSGPNPASETVPERVNVSLFPQT